MFFFRAPPQTPQKGNALFLILIAVALFAALSYAVTRSGGGGASGTNRERAQLDASIVLQYASSVEQAVTRLLLTGCTPSTVNFVGAPQVTNDNPAAPSDDSCDVFKPEGGAVTVQSPPIAVYLDPTRAANERGYRMQNQNFDMEGKADRCSDAYIIMYGVTDAFCEAVNSILQNGVPVLPGNGGGDYSSLDHTQYACGSPTPNPNTGNPLAWCRRATNPPGGVVYWNAFYYTVMTR